jgi:hypothetical protein
MKYILDKDELDGVKVKLLANVTDFITELVDNHKKSSIGIDVSGWPSMSSKDRMLTINFEKFLDSVDKLKHNMADTINNL